MMRHNSRTLVTTPAHLSLEDVDFTRGDRATVTCDGNDVSGIFVEADTGDGNRGEGWVDVYVTHNGKVLLNDKGEPTLFRLRGEVVIIHEKRRERVAL